MGLEAGHEGDGRRELRQRTWWAQEKVILQRGDERCLRRTERDHVSLYGQTNMQIRISSVIDGGNNTAKVAWSDARNTTRPRTVNSLVSGLPAGLIDANGSVIFRRSHL